MLKRANRFAMHPGWRLLIQDMGMDPVDVLSHAELPADLFAAKDAWLSPAEYFRLWHGLEASSNGRNVAVLLGKSISVETFDPPIYASFCSANFNVALRRLAEYKRLIGPLVADVSVGSQETAVTLTCYGYDRLPPPSFAITEAVFLTQLARMATRSAIRPLSCELVTLPGHQAECEAFLGCSIRQGSTNTIRFSAEDAARPFLSENLAMRSFFEPGLRARLATLDGEASISERVRAVLLDMLPSGASSIDEVAKRLVMSTRSLQRRLTQSNLNYRDVLSDLRRELASHYLHHSDLSPAEISYLLGFDDPNSFLRSFKEWTGQTPGRFRSESRDVNEDEVRNVQGHRSKTSF
ncbi:HTH-type transcriptional regulator VirS [Rhizobium sp. CECT 9324]|nr:HTH-type transcriptional regulator VirS [Rhizobium sp. CECT 9324]